MSDSVQMPALGESVTEGTVTRWLKQVGEHVDVDEPLLEVSTDKVDTEIPSPVAGVLQEILVSEDETVAVGTALARIGDGEGGGEQPQQEQPRTEPAADRVQAESTVPTPDVDAPPVRPSSTEVEQPAERPHPTAEPAGDGGERVQMPALGESVTEGTVTRWLKQEGDSVEVDEPLLEVSTDKVDTEIPSPVAGVVRKILVGEDETVAVGADLVVVGPAGGAAPAAAQPPQQQSQPAAQPSQPAPQQSQPAPQQSQQQAPPPPAPPAPRPAPASAAPAPAPAPAPQRAASPSGDTAPASGSGGSAPSQDGSGYAEYPAANPAPAPSGEQSPAQAQAAQALRSPEAPAAGTDGDGAGGQGADPSVYVTPLVRRLATEHGVDLAGITGTGVGGRVRKQDVLDAAKAKQQAAAAPAPAPAPAAAPAAPAAAASRPAPAVSALRGTTVKMSRLRKVVAQRMVESLQVSAQLTTVVEVDVTRIARLRARAKGEFEAREGVKLSFLPFFAVAAVEALKQYPVVNASIDGDQVVYHGEENLGIAVDTERGLVVPVVRNAGDLNIAGVARKIADLADRTRNNKITPDDLGGGTFTLTNTGSRGALFDTPIINQPQVAILGTGAVVKRPVVVPGADGEETIAIRSMVYLALTYDHRIVDGADAARFLVAVKQRLEEGAFEADLGL